jgi:D-arabinose 1-dehydrogenase-like Zn-dependent alcohol dehydrogenase
VRVPATLRLRLTLVDQRGEVAAWCVTLPAQGTFEVPILDTVLGGKSVIGSIDGTRADLAEVVRRTPLAA